MNLHFTMFAALAHVTSLPTIKNIVIAFSIGCGHDKIHICWYNRLSNGYCGHEKIGETVGFVFT
jgi:hypothetical protein